MEELLEVERWISDAHDLIEEAMGLHHNNTVYTKIVFRLAKGADARTRLSWKLIKKQLQGPDNLPAFVKILRTSSVDKIKNGKKICVPCINSSVDTEDEFWIFIIPTRHPWTLFEVYHVRDLFDNFFRTELSRLSGLPPRIKSHFVVVSEESAEQAVLRN